MWVGKYNEEDLVEILPKDIKDELVSLVTVLKLTNKCNVEIEFFSSRIQILEYSWKSSKGSLKLSMSIDVIDREISNIMLLGVIGPSGGSQEAIYSKFPSGTNKTSLDIINEAKSYI